ncbi:unnamed protein product, partial [Iphiclides podalirius]
MVRDIEDVVGSKRDTQSFHGFIFVSYLRRPYRLPGDKVVALNRLDLGSTDEHQDTALITVSASAPCRRCLRAGAPGDALGRPNAIRADRDLFLLR